MFELIATNQPDTHYIHCPEQLLVEYICHVAGVISLWTGFSILSIYSFAKRFYRERNVKIDIVKNNSLCNNCLYHCSGGAINQIRFSKRKLLKNNNSFAGKSCIENQKF